MRYLFALLAVFISLAGHAQPVSEHDLKAFYIYKIALFTEWPQGEQDSFNMCSLADGNVGAAMKKLEGRRIGDRRIVVANLSSLAAIGQCQVLFIGERATTELPKIASLLGDKPILTVTDVPLLASVGVVLALDDQRLLFDVNLELCRRINLRPMSAMLLLARNVKKS